MLVQAGDSGSGAVIRAIVAAQAAGSPLQGCKRQQGPSRNFLSGKVYCLSLDPSCSFLQNLHGDSRCGTSVSPFSVLLVSLSTHVSNSLQPLTGMKGT